MGLERSPSRIKASRLALAMACCAVVGVSGAGAAVTSSGDISPAPPAGGGAIAGPFRIGITDVGTMGISGGTPITSTGAAVIGDTLTGLGIVTMSGFGSDWTLTTAGGDLTVGNSGSGSMSLSSLALMSVNDDLLVAAQLNSLGRISISGLGTIFDVGDDAHIGQRSQAIIEIFSGGRLINDQSIVGDEPAGDGRVTVSGEFSLWRTSNTLTIADAGRASLQIFDGARVETTAPSGIISATIANQAGSTGTVEVIGLGSILQNALGMIVGEFGHGTLVVADGGRVSMGTGANLFTIGRQIGSTGTVEVRGANSLLTAALTEVGDSGDGTLRILDGGRVVTGLALIGDNSSARGEALVDGVGSAWEVTGEINVSDPGEAHLTISNGGLVRSSSLTRVAALGQLTLNRGRLEIGGTVGLLNTGAVDGNGTIESLKADNNAGGRIRPFGSDPLLFTGTLNNSGLVDVNAGVLEVIGPTNNNLDIDARNGAILRFRGTGLDNNSGAQLAITSGNVDVFGLVNNDAGAEIAVGGTAVAVFHDAVTNNGTIFVQAGGRVLMLENLGFSPSSMLSMPLTSSGMGQVDVSGSAALDGGLHVALEDGFVPRVGDRYDVLGAGAGRSGTFSAVTTDPGAPVQFHGIYTPTSADILVAGAGDKTWGVDAAGASSLGSNWLGGVAPGGVDDKAAFTTIITASRTVTVDAPLTAGSLYFDDDDAYRLEGPGHVTLDVSAGSARIDVKDFHGTGGHTIAVPLVLNDATVVDVASAGQLHLAGPVTGAAVTKSGAGTMTVRSLKIAGGLAVNDGAVDVVADGGATGLLRAAGVTVSPGAALRLSDNDLIVDYTAASPENDVRQFFRDDRITSLGTPANDTVLAVADNADLGRTIWLGQTIDLTTVIGKYTYFGDSNLDGMVTGDDYLAIDTNLGIGTDWIDGDFNMDNAVTGDDYLAIDTNLGKGTTNPLAYAELKEVMIAKHVAMFGEEYLVKLAEVEANGFVTVPEPGVGAMMISFACAMLAPRRRRS